jgi:hypothetical protein
MSNRQTFFLVSAVLFIGAALFHLYGLLSSLSDMRLVGFHGAFVIIDPATALLLLRRPDWFPYAFAVLTLQQIYSHGMDALVAWHGEARVDVISLFIVVFMPALLALLIYDAVNRKRETS